MIGKKYGRLTILKLDETKSGRHKYYICECECGNKKSVRLDCLKSGNTKSCGCLIHEPKGDGRTKEKLYHVWAGIKDRCNNPNNAKYQDYGGRGIKVYPEWNGSHDYINFKNWALNNGYRNGLSIDRIDVNGNYEPNNCRWTTQKVQTRNMRNNINITYKGETHVLQDWAEILNINPNTLYSRIIILKWSIEDAFENHDTNNYMNGLNKANEKNKQEYENKRNMIISRIKQLVSSNTPNEIINIIKKEYSIKDSRTIYKFCCNTPRKCDFVDWLKKL